MGPEFGAEGGAQPPPPDEQGCLHFPSTLRNRDPILAVLRRVLTPGRLVLEVASGSGEHAVHFARHLQGCTWQPSDPVPDHRASIRSWGRMARLDNLREPLDLDVRREPWPCQTAEAVVCVNLLHIAPWETTEGLLRGAGRVLTRGGVLYVYGAFTRRGCPTAPSNLEFDRQLRASNPAWGLREADRVVELARQHGLELAEMVPMPTNNFSLIFVQGGS